MSAAEESDGSAAEAAAVTDQFVDAGIAKLDAVFGAGYAKENPAVLAAYIATCSSTFSTLALTSSNDAAMAALGDLDDEILDDDELDDEDDEFVPPPPPPAKRKRTR
ncbi:hypothetical protein [Acuticoccus yangtzensis]|uniref:hypothetical protein n=1 Tax=Acuticoccus yangtzensis TaxID=1443441 RepID=UPI000949AD1B|nr:hypothetical protein [Acuticoccus yangtzensis]